MDRATSLTTLETALSKIAFFLIDIYLNIKELLCIRFHICHVFSNDRKLCSTEMWRGNREAWEVM